MRIFSSFSFVSPEETSNLTVFDNFRKTDEEVLEAVAKAGGDKVVSLKAVT